MKKRIYTKRPMELCSVRLPKRIKELWRAAAAQEEISQSEFLREAIRDKAKDVLLGEQEGQVHA